MESYAHWKCALEQQVDNYSLRGQVAKDCSAGHWIQNLILAVDSRLPLKEVNPGITLKMEV